MSISTEKNSQESNDFKNNDKMQSNIENNIKIILETARIEYKSVSYDAWSTQNSNIRNSIWVSFLIISAETALMFNVFSFDNFITIYKCVMVDLFISLIISFLSFILAIDSMRSRGKSMRPIFGTYPEFIKKSKIDIHSDEIIKDTIDAFENCIQAELERIDFLGKRMNLLSKLNVISSSIGGLAFLSYFLIKISLL
ncbi:membrane hypothetical protein [uncultured Desulfovibrio sp.]|uniref:Uncharacterized protein n=1 Tax=uncultured Desulfovibrio sp. TaxID=167968 RepID=A0A212KEM5_9BACT|nr:hypothetical protein [uncultured Desulfovibrio sp.]SBW10091.1 membrane hypothetical protein [uncultured Desulfovibrio sp.]